MNGSDPTKLSRTISCFFVGHVWSEWVSVDRTALHYRYCHVCPKVVWTVGHREGS